MKSQRVSNGVLICISNNGEIEEGILGIGLENCRQRLRLLYDDKANLTISQRDGFVFTELFIPYFYGEEALEIND